MSRGQPRRLASGQWTILAALVTAAAAPLLHQIAGRKTKCVCSLSTQHNLGRSAECGRATAHLVTALVEVNSTYSLPRLEVALTLQPAPVMPISADRIATTVRVWRVQRRNSIRGTMRTLAE
jgi:hypothetical protein